MDSFSPPQLDLDYVCITAKNNAVISSLISSYFNRPGTYFIIFTFPDLENVYKKENSVREDDNNTCSSWYEIAITFIASGTRAYIGTIWRVDNLVAREAANSYYEHLLTKGNLLNAFYEMTQGIKPAKYRNIYLYWGLHFNTMKSPTQKPDQEVFNVLVASLIEWQREYDSAKGQDVKQQCLGVLRFLVQEIKTNFTPTHLEQFNVDLAARLADANELSDKDDRFDDDLRERGVIDL